MLYCLPSSLAGGGPGLGTCGCPPAEVERLCRQAGFANVQTLPIENPLNMLYAATPVAA
jgi:hypothetical protein